MDLFPYPEIREPQKEMVDSVRSCLENKENLIVHAPTGIGKTAAVLAPALQYALDNNKIVLFLTSRHTQHKIAIDTLSEIKQKHKIEFAVSDIIGKRWMCVQNKIELLGAKEFQEYCKSVREDYKCEFYANTRHRNVKPTAAANQIVKELSVNPHHIEEINSKCKKERLCPYEIATLLAKNSRVVVADYYYMFNTSVRNTFLRKIERDLSDIIIIIDEGHNLAGRIRDLLSDRLTSVITKRAIKEAKKFRYPETLGYIVGIQDALNFLGEKIDEKNESLVSKKEFFELINKIKGYDELVADLKLVGDEIKQKHKISFIGSIGGFLERWQGEDEGYMRMIQSFDYGIRKGLSLVYRCLDPSVESNKVIKEAHSVIMMSGTLTPTEMYRDLLGFESAKENVLESPFPAENRLNLIVPKTTTKFTKRGEEQYRLIGKEVAKLGDLIKGNVAVFFPSYYVRDQVYRYMFDECSKTLFLEEPGMNKGEKQEMLEKFKSYNKVGAILLGVVAANFSEGIDLPGDFLNGVIIVGLPLSKPDLETMKLIEYYDKKFCKGWDYGYLFPAMNKTLQAAGRCIRSESDKGVIVFLDERYAWPNYKRCFPEETGLKIIKEYEKVIDEFYS